VELTFEPLRLRLRHTWTIARGSANEKVNGLLSLTAEGVTGRGEAAFATRGGQSFAGAHRAFSTLRRAVAALDPWAQRLWLEAAERAAGAQTGLCAALDAALWDWRGKRLGQPLHRLLGTRGDRVPPTSFSIAIDEPGRMAQRAREAAGYDILKLKVGLGDDRRRILAVRAAVPGRRLRVDANGGWHDPTLARVMIAWLAGQGVELVEQPLPAGQEERMRQLRDASPLPLVADESVQRATDLVRVVGAYHGVNVKLAKCGGVTRALEMITRARSLGLKVMLGCMIESSLGIAAALALAPLVDWVDLDGNLLLDGDPFGGLAIEGGRWRLPTAPGLGVSRR
jgi:L-alanine-DL-glutamate epimerase-like enolase superfamily enzyme